MLRSIATCFCLLAAPALADGWETFSHDLGAGAAVCPYDDADSGAFFCFAVACLQEGGPPMIRVALSGQEVSQYNVPLSVRVDGRMVSHLFLTRIEEDGMYDFGIAFDPARDAGLIEALKAGSRATLIFGIGLSAIVQDVSLKGSHTALDEVSSLCGSLALNGAE